MRFPWKRLDQATLQITVWGTAVLFLGLGSGIIIGAELEPPEVVEIRTTVTLAKPPVCGHANAAASIALEKWNIWATQSGYVDDHAAAAFEAQVHGNVDAMIEEQALANAAALLRDEARLAEIGAEQSFMNHTAACETWTVAQRFTERIPQ
jgi:hypothetical protein